MTSPTPDPEQLPPTFPVQVASKILGIGRNRTYERIKAGSYPIRVINTDGRFRVSKYDLLAYLKAASRDA